MRSGEENTADSAGVPWAGRRFEPNPRADDDGSAPPRLLAVLEGFRAGTADAAAVVDEVRVSRLLVPLLAEAGDVGYNAKGQKVDKTQELAIVTVEAPDGRRAMPAFTSVGAMTAWNPSARPVPVEAVRLALAAAGEGTDLVVLDPTSPTEFGIRRPAVWAIAKQEPWTPSWADEALAAEYSALGADIAEVVGVALEAGDPDARLTQAELLVRVRLTPGLGTEDLRAVMAVLTSRWSQSELIAERVDSMSVALEAAR